MALNLWFSLCCGMWFTDYVQITPTHPTASCFYHPLDRTETHTRHKAWMCFSLANTAHWYYDNRHFFESNAHTSIAEVWGVWSGEPIITLIPGTTKSIHFHNYTSSTFWPPVVPLILAIGHAVFYLGFFREAIYIADDEAAVGNVGVIFGHSLWVMHIPQQRLIVAESACTAQPVCVWVFTDGYAGGQTTPAFTLHL